MFNVQYQNQIRIGIYYRYSHIIYGLSSKKWPMSFFCLASVSNGIGIGISTMRQLANNWHTQIYWKIDNVGCMAKIFLIMHSKFHLLAISRFLIQFNNRKSETLPRIIAWKLSNLDLFFLIWKQISKQGQYWKSMRCDTLLTFIYSIFVAFSKKTYIWLNS